MADLDSTRVYGDLTVTGSVTAGGTALQNVALASGTNISLSGAYPNITVTASNTNLGYTASTRVLTSSTGSNVTLPQVTTSNDGLMIASDKSKLNGIANNATANTGTVTSVTGGDGLSGTVTTSGSLAVDGTVVRTSGNQTIGGVKRFVNNLTSATYDSQFGTGSSGAGFIAGYHSTGGAPSDSPTGGQTSVLHIGNPWGRAQIAIPNNGGLFYRHGTAVNWLEVLTTTSGLNASNLSSGTVADARLPSTAVRTSRTLTAGDGLSGGGNLGSNRTFNVDSTVVRTSGSQSIGGIKTFTSNMRTTGHLSFTGQASSRPAYGIYRSSGNNVWLTCVNELRLGIYDTGRNDDNFRLRDYQGNIAVRIRSNNTRLASPVRFDAVHANTTSSSANLQITSSGNLYRSTSSIKYKKDVETADPDYYRKVLDLRPVFYRAKNTGDADLDWSYWGFIAEEAAEVDPRLVHWSVPDAEDEWADKTPEERKAVAEPNGMQYDRVAVLLQAVVKDHDNEINELKKQIEDLKEIIKGLVK